MKADIAETQVTKTVLPKITRGILACSLMGLTGQALSAPAVSGTSGTFDHKATITVSGSGFGTKSTAAPAVWDDASGSSMLSKWDGAWPSSGPSGSTYLLTYRAPQRGIALPHSRITRYIAGAHGDSAGATGGYNVIMWKNRTISSYPAFVYASWYQRVDDKWAFNIGSPADNNFKTFAYSACCTPYEMPNNWYLNFGPPHPNSPTDPTAQWSMNDDGSTWQNPDMNGHNNWWYNGINPMSGQWARIEVAIRLTNQSDGYVKVWENGSVKVDYLGPTDRYPGTNRSVGIGGYARGYGNPNQWRYFADVYLDFSLSRVVLANNADLSRATIIEPQIPSNWSATSIDVSVNLGKLTAGQTAYMFVFDSTGARNTTGFPITVGGTGGGGSSLQAPPNLMVR